MNCQDFETTILSMARAQLLEASARRQALAHIAGCPACADWLAEQQTLTAAVRATTKSLRDEEASAHVEQSLRAAFRKQTGAARLSSAPPHMRRWPKRALAAVAAVFLLFPLAGWLWQWSLADRSQKTAIAPPAPKVNEKSPAPPVPVNRPEVEKTRQAAGHRRRMRPPVSRGATAGEETATDFIVLANENQLVPLESGQVLRVELSTSALISMGLRITAEDVSKPVLADLLVGQDGLPRAIRFVRAGTTEASDSQEPSTNK